MGRPFAACILSLCAPSCRSRRHRVANPESQVKRAEDHVSVYVGSEGLHVIGMIYARDDRRRRCRMRAAQARVSHKKRERANDD